MMADIRNDELTTEESASPQPLDKPEKARPGKKKKKKRGCGFLLLMMLLAGGVAAGVQLSGGADLRPYVYEIVPRIPVVGSRAAELAGIPERYSFTIDQRRRIELDEWEMEIANKTRSLDALMKAAEKTSGDLALREKAVEEDRDELTRRLEALSADLAGAAGEGLTANQRDELDRIVKTFEEMSPKNAAAILEKLNEKLSVAVLDQLPEDFRAKALGRMDAEVAAALMELLSEYQKKN